MQALCRLCTDFNVSTMGHTADVDLILQLIPDPNQHVSSK